MKRARTHLKGCKGEERYWCSELMSEMPRCRIEAIRELLAEGLNIIQPYDSVIKDWIKRARKIL